MYVEWGVLWVGGVTVVCAGVRDIVVCGWGVRPVQGGMPGLRVCVWGRQRCVWVRQRCGWVASALCVGDISVVCEGGTRVRPMCGGRDSREVASQGLLESTPGLIFDSWFFVVKSFPFCHVVPNIMFPTWRCLAVVFAVCHVVQSEGCFFNFVMHFKSERHFCFPCVVPFIIFAMYWVTIVFTGTVQNCLLRTYNGNDCYCGGIVKMLLIIVQCWSLLPWGQCNDGVCCHGDSAMMVFVVRGTVQWWCLLSWEQCNDGVCCHGDSAMMVIVVMGTVQWWWLLSGGQCNVGDCCHGNSAMLVIFVLGAVQKRLLQTSSDSACWHGNCKHVLDAESLKHCL